MGGAGGGKPKLHMVVVGHVDAGKSTLMGRLLYELGVVSQKEVHKQEREAGQAGKASFSWAWLLDERPQERSRGITVDLAHARFETPARRIALLDAPGHRDFVPNMIAGAAQADCAVLVVDGSVGGFEAGFRAASSVPGGQTREHAQLLRSLGVSQLAVAVTKLDTCAFSQARYEEIRGLLQPFLRQCGYPETSVRWLPVSGPTGQNITERPSEAALASWWTGPTLLQVIDSFAPPGQQLTWPLRLPVSDVAGSRAGSAVLSGKLEAGSVQVGDKVTVVPGGQEGTVKAISVDGEKATRAGAGDAAEVTVQGLDASLLSPGAVLCAAGHPIPLASRFRTRVLLFDPPSPIIMGQPVTVHAHAAQGSGHVVALGPLLDPRSGNVVKDRQRALTKGQTAEIVVAVQRPLPLELYKDLRPLGRVALREKGRTLAVGIVTEIL